MCGQIIRSSLEEEHNNGQRNPWNVVNIIIGILKKINWKTHCENPLIIIRDSSTTIIGYNNEKAENNFEKIQE